MTIRLPRKHRLESISDRSEPYDLLSIKQAAAFVSVSQISIRRWIKAKRLRCYRVGRQLRINKADLVEFMYQY